MKEFPRTNESTNLPAIEKTQALEQVSQIEEALNCTSSVKSVIDVLQKFKASAPVVNGTPVLFYESSIAGIEDQFVTYDEVIEELTLLSDAIPEDKDYIISHGYQDSEDLSEIESDSTKIIDISGMDSKIPDYIFEAVLEIIDV